MAGKDPSPGYSILAKLLDETRHKVVVTTNFDNLVADALSIYTRTYPMMIGHEALANFVSVVPRRPVICKIHRDLLFGPKNDRRSLRRLHESWAATLRALFGHYTPVFIGYGGNDDSLMDLLESLDPEDISGRLIWCYYAPYEPSERISALVAQHRGVLVPVPDFDLLMILIGHQRGIGLLDQTITTRAKERETRYHERLLNLDTTAHPDVAGILGEAFERAGGAWAWLQKAKREITVGRREQVLRQGLEQCGDSEGLEQLRLELARLLWMHNRDVDTAASIFDGLCAQEPDDFRLEYLRLLFWIDGLGRYDDALTRAREMVTHADQRYYGSRVLCVGLLAQGRFGEALDVWQQYLVDSNALNIVSIGAALLALTGDVDAGAAALRRAHETHSHNAEAHLSLAKFLWAWKNDVNSAKGLFDYFATEPTDDSGQLLSCAHFYLAIGEVPQAGRLLKAVKQLYPKNWDTAANLATLDGLLARLCGNSDRQYLCALKTLLDANRTPSSQYPLECSLNGRLIQAMKDRLEPPVYELYMCVVKAMHDPAEYPALQALPLWQEAIGTDASSDRSD